MPKTKQDNDLVRAAGSMNAKKGGNIWIGLDDLQNEGDFHWSDDSELDGWTNWSPKQPNNAGKKGEDCVAILAKNGKWNDLACGKRQLVVCEVPADKITFV